VLGVVVLTVLIEQIPVNAPTFVIEKDCDGSMFETWKNPV